MRVADPPPGEESVRAQVRRITESQPFAQSDRLKQFLQFVTDRALAGRSIELKESVLAIEIFGRAGTGEGGSDSLVRVTATKVRAKLKEYYLTSGSEDPLVIELPRGTYVPVFRASNAKPESATGSRWILIAAVAAVLILTVAVARSNRNPAGRAGSRTDPAVNLQYLEAVQFSKQFTGAGRVKSIDLLRKVIQRDPRFLPAYVTLADVYLNPLQVQTPWVEVSEARVLLAKASELAPESPDVLRVMGILKFQYDWDGPAAEKHFRRAITLDPDTDLPRQRLSEMFAYMGRTDEALREAELGLRVNPTADRMLTIVCLANYLGRRFDRALEAANRNIELHPNSLSGHLLLGVIQAGSGHAPEAITALERLLTIHKDAAPLGYLGALGHAYAVGGRRDDAMRLLHKLETASRERWVPPVFVARIYTGLGMKSQALDLLERAFEQHDPNVVWLKLDPRMDPLRGEERYRALLRRLGF